MNVKIALLVVATLFFSLFTILKIYDYNVTKKKELPYKNFITNIKSERYLQAYTVLYPLVKGGDKKAIEIISSAYANDGYGLKKDLIKSNIWKYRGEFGNSAGEIEYQKFQNYLKSNNLNYASAYLQTSAEMGNKKAIILIQDDKYLIDSNLKIDENWRKYWRDFIYDDLYPYYKEINSNNRFDTPIL